MNDCKNNRRDVVVNTGWGRRSKMEPLRSGNQVSLEKEVSVPAALKRKYDV